VSRFLFVVPPLTGHTNPTVAVGAALRERGHAVAWTGYSSVARPLLPAWATLIPVGDDPADDDPALAEARQRSQGLRGAEALEFLWQDFLLPLGRAMVPGVEAAVSSFRPDVLVVDQQAIAGAVVAQRRGIPWATSATTSAELVDPFALLPKVGEWVASELGRFQADFGVVVGAGDLRFSPDLVLAFTSAALAGPGRPFPDHYRFVGPSFGGRPAPVEFPWEWLDPPEGARQLVLVSLGTINAEAGRRFLREAVSALRQLSDRVQGVVVGPADLLSEGEGGPGGPGGLGTGEEAGAGAGVGAGAGADSVLVRPYVPQVELLSRAAAVVSHGGHNTVCETLAHGLPLVVAPIRDDQPIVAQQVTDAGAGVRVKFGRVRAADLQTAVTEVLENPCYREAAQRLQASFDAAGGAAAAAAALMELADRERLAIPLGKCPQVNA
jgi:UDP:flavonoid glycosyltransferase YjiC (YdhE family)